ncbi:ABC transporter ATP-binding protein [Sodalis sp. RH15]|uniref:ABC transporter ATP-binding protein n=1 Tax=Sodalis sp. RH15 TaxID=3394330 RepID=UPI0039B6D4FE
MELRDVRVRFPVGADWRGKAKSYVHALNGLDLAVRRGETLGIVGESGCGKSTLAQLMMGLLAPSSGAIFRARSSGSWFGSGMQMVFQDPQSSLDPRLPVWRTITEPVYVQYHNPVRERRALAEALADQVGIRGGYLDRLPHEFSGGQRQRLSIARALSSEPDIVVLDEPTSALDVSVQAQILNLLVELQASRQLTYVLISHNVSVVRYMSDRVAVMYLGQIVELGDSQEVLNHPRHPYTRLLLDSVPHADRPLQEADGGVGELPDNRKLPPGCFFFDRCPYAGDGCQMPQRLEAKASGVEVRCHRV